MFKLDGKIAAVTGSEGLLGKQFCRALVEHGAIILPLDLKTGFDVMTDDLPPCDILVNCARTEWTGMVRLAKQMKQGCVINIASVYGVVAPDFRIYEDTEIAPTPIEYTATKAAVIGITKHLASQMAPNVRVNCISPGGIENGHSEKFKANYSARVPMGRMAQPEEMNRALIFLACDPYINGQNIVIDGGLTIW